MYQQVYGVFKTLALVFVCSGENATSLVYCSLPVYALFKLPSLILSLSFHTQVTEISMGEFLMHSSAVWLNPHPSLGRMRKDPEMTVFGESGPMSLI